MLKIHSGLPRLQLRRPPEPPGPGAPAPIDQVQISKEKPRRHPLRWLATPVLLGAMLLGPLGYGMVHSYPQAQLPRAEMQVKLATLRADLRTHQLKAARGEETGGQALCSMLKEEAAMSRSSEEFVQLNQALWVHNDWIVNLPTGAPTIPHTYVNQPPLEQFAGLPTSGWKLAYKDQIDGKVNQDDQTHHLAAYVSLGYYRGSEFSAAGAYYHELENNLENGGDINLGVLGGQFGATLRHTSPQQLQSAVSQLCSRINDAGAKPAPVHWTVPDQP